MKRSDIALAAQLLTAIKDAVERLEKAKRKKDNVCTMEAKQEILHFQKQLKELLNADK